MSDHGSLLIRGASWLDTATGEASRPVPISRSPMACSSPPTATQITRSMRAG